MSEEQNERSELSVLGRTIGTFTGWDQGDTLVLVFYEFEPTKVKLPPGDLNVDYEAGKYQVWKDETELVSGDLVELLMELPNEH